MLYLGAGGVCLKWDPAATAMRADNVRKAHFAEMRV